MILINLILTTMLKWTEEIGKERGRKRSWEEGKEKEEGEGIKNQEEAHEDMERYVKERTDQLKDMVVVVRAEEKDFSYGRSPNDDIEYRLIVSEAGNGGGDAVVKVSFPSFSNFPGQADKIKNFAILLSSVHGGMLGPCRIEIELVARRFDEPTKEIDRATQTFEIYPAGRLGNLGKFVEGKNISLTEYGQKQIYLDLYIKKVIPSTSKLPNDIEKRYGLLGTPVVSRG